MRAYYFVHVFIRFALKFLIIKMIHPMRMEHRMSSMATIKTTLKNTRVIESYDTWLSSSLVFRFLLQIRWRCYFDCIFVVFVRWKFIIENGFYIVLESNHRNCGTATKCLIRFPIQNRTKKKSQLIEFYVCNNYRCYVAFYNIESNGWNCKTEEKGKCRT